MGDFVFPVNSLKTRFFRRARRDSNHKPSVPQTPVKNSENLMLIFGLKKHLPLFFEKSDKVAINWLVNPSIRK